MVNRTTYSGASTPPVSGTDYLDQVAERFDTLFDASALPLISIAGTGDAVTAVLDPPLAVAGTFVDGMKFTLTWAAANSAGVTLAINGGSALAVVDASGAALAAGALASGLRSLIEYVGGSFRVLTQVAADAGTGNYFWQITASDTWNKPAGLDDDRMVIVEAWGGGAGGGNDSNDGGGGGGGYVCRRFRAADLPSSVTVTIGNGGAADANGVNTTFGALLTAYAGARSNGSTGGGGGGGGELGAGSQGSSGAATPQGGGAGGAVGGGAGGHGHTDGPGDNGNHAGSIWGGGGGGGGSSGTGGTGGSAVHGGAGGGGPSASGGVSLFGGNGGADGVAGSAPGGGGGQGAAGARGEVRIWI